MSNLLYYYIDEDFYIYDFKPILVTYEIIKETYKGYWIQESNFKPIWIKKQAKNQKGFKTKIEALKNYLYRKNYQKNILETKLKNVKYRVEDAKILLKEMENIKI